MTNITKAAQDALEALEALMEGSMRGLSGWPETWGLIRMPTNSAMNKGEAALNALRAALQDKAVEDATIEDNSQQWAGMDGATAWLLINRHADGWGDVDKMMSEWLKANTRPAPVVPDDVARYRLIRNGLAYIEPHESGEIYVAGESGVYTKNGDEFDAAIDAIASSQQKGGQ